MKRYLYPPALPSVVPLPLGAATEATLAALNAKVTNDFGVSSAAVRVAALLGNASGLAAFGSGVVTAQTLRTFIATDQTPIPVTQSGTWNINNISGIISLPTGASTSVLQTTGNTSLSSIDTKLTTTNSSLSSIDAGIPVALGQTIMAASMPVTLASDQTSIPFEICSTAAVTNPAVSTSSATILASNSARKMAIISNDSGRTLLVKFGATASSTSFTVRLTSNDYYELPHPVYTGRIDAITTAGTGNILVTELTT